MLWLARSPRSHGLAFVGMFAYWLGDVACLWATLHAFEARTRTVDRRLRDGLRDHASRAAARRRRRRRGAASVCSPLGEDRARAGAARGPRLPSHQPVAADDSGTSGPAESAPPAAITAGADSEHTRSFQTRGEPAWSRQLTFQRTAGLAHSSRGEASTGVAHRSPPESSRYGFPATGIRTPGATRS